MQPSWSFYVHFSSYHIRVRTNYSGSVKANICINQHQSQVPEFRKGCPNKVNKSRKSSPTTTVRNMTKCLYSIEDLVHSVIALSQPIGRHWTMKP